MSEYAEVLLAEQFSTVVTSAAGYPLDKTYYQTVKGMVTPIEIMAPGADLIIASACSEGMGSQEFRDAQRRLVAAAGAVPRGDQQEALRRHRRVADGDAACRCGSASIQLYSDGLAEPSVR